MSISIASKFNMLPIITQPSTSCFSKLTFLASSLKESILGTTKKHPLLTTTIIALGTCAVAGLITYKYYTSMDTSIESLVIRSSGLADQPCKENIATFLEENWHKLGLPDSCNNLENRGFLKEKLFNIIKIHHRQTIALRQEISKNVIKNFRSFISQSIVRVKHDLVNDNQFRALFNIQDNLDIQRVEILGDETHNKGSNPLCIAIVLGGERKIIYKPRSVRSERLICATNESLFQRLGLPTYHVYEKEEENYGYCECLENRQEENTFNTRNELQQLYIEFGKIEKVARAIGLSDLHDQNIIIVNQRPYLIDTEVVSLPTDNEHYQTHLLGTERPGALATRKTNKNHIWFTEDLIQSFDVSKGRKGYSFADIPRELYRTGMTNDVLKCSGLEEFIQEISDQTLGEIVDFDLGNLQEVRAKLRAHNNRIVLVETTELSADIRHSPDRAREYFEEDLRNGLTAWGFQMDHAQREAVLDKFEEDLKNNDIPIFYHNAEAGKVFYGDLIIGYHE